MPVALGARPPARSLEEPFGQQALIRKTSLLRDRSDGPAVKLSRQYTDAHAPRRLSAATRPMLE
jgi:hypothetical protein